MAKEWSGNSRAAQYALAIKKSNSQEEREQDDFYATDPKALEMLLGGASEWLQKVFDKQKCKQNTLRDHIPGFIWECACGNGNLASYLIKNGFKVYATDLKDRGYGIRGIDFLQSSANADIILTNPPYSLANEFILHALELLPTGGVYIALMNMACLAGQKRYDQIYSSGQLREVYIFSKRIGCWKNNVRDDKKAHIIHYAWYVFQKGYRGQPQIYWL